MQLFLIKPMSSIILVIEENNCLTNFAQFKNFYIENNY